MDDQPALPGQTLAAYIEKKWGGPTRTTPLTSVTVDGSAPRVLQNNPRRFAYIFLNPGSANMYIGWSYSEAITLGFVITPLGGSLTLLADEDGELVGQALFAYSPTLTQTAYVQETFRK